MNKELKKAIVIWLLDNENVFNRLNNCVDNFRDYIYDKEGNYLTFGGEKVHLFISRIDKLLYGGDLID